MSFRIAVFTGALGRDVQRSIDQLVRTQADAEIFVLVHRPARDAKRLIRNQVKNLKRHGWRWVPYQAAEVLQLLLGGRHKKREWQRPARVEVISVPAINGPEAVEKLRQFRPQLGLAIAAPILRPAVFDIPELGTLNIHKGKLPDYRGMPPAFWEIWNGADAVGVTVHRVDAGLDTGPILLEETVPIEPHSTPAGLRVRLDELGVKLIVKAVEQVRTGEARYKPQPPGGTTNSRPLLAQEAALRRRLRPRTLRATVKNSVFTTYSTLKRPQTDRALILLYHRVSDSFRDSVTIGVEQFDEQMRFLADRTNLVSLEALLSGNVPAEGPLVAVTFDDGYRDNYDNAAPILLKHGVPATFFVSTDMITHNKPFDHDLQKLGHGLPNMNWHQIREMQAEGFGFGSHTANHINLARSAPDLVEKELRSSLATLRQELGLTDVMFAYPFGKRGDITPERLEQVRRAGYVASCSAYGGLNDRTVDRWDIRRQGVDHTFSIPAVKAKLAGWKATDYV